MAILKAGTRLRSAVSTVEVMITKAPAGEVTLSCGDSPMIDINTAGDPTKGAEGSVDMGKRYIDAAGTLELLCTKPGQGNLSLNGEVLQIRGNKALPSSD